MLQYHLNMFEKYAMSMTQDLKELINKNNRDLKIFFILLCQMLVVQDYYFIALYIIEIKKDQNPTLWNRVEDISVSMIMVSYTLMYFGFSRMVRGAYVALQK